MVNLIKVRDAVFFHYVMGIYTSLFIRNSDKMSTKLHTIQTVSLGELNLAYETYHTRILFFLKETYVR